MRIEKSRVSLQGQTERWLALISRVCCNNACFDGVSVVNSSFDYSCSDQKPCMATYVLNDVAKVHMLPRNSKALAGR